MTRILICDDDAAICELLVQVLEMEGYQAECGSGASGLAAALSHEPHLILLDVMMPDIDGLALKEELNRHPQTAAIPVILMTALRNPQKWFASLGAINYLVKPFDLDYMLKMVRDTLRRTPEEH